MRRTNARVSPSYLQLRKKNKRLPERSLPNFLENELNFSLYIVPGKIHLKASPEEKCFQCFHVLDFWAWPRFWSDTRFWCVSFACHCVSGGMVMGVTTAPLSLRGVTTAPLNACQGVPPPRVCVSFACRKAHFPRLFLVFPFHRKCNFWIQWGRLNAADSRLTNWGVLAFVEITETKICLLIMLLTLRKLLLWHSGRRWSHWKWLQKILPIPMHSYLAQRHVCFDNTT